MKKRFLSIAICFCLMIASVFTFAACGEKKLSAEKAADKLEPASAPIMALNSCFNELTNGNTEDLGELDGHNAAIVSYVEEALEMIFIYGEMLTYVGNYEEVNKEYGEFITKKGDTYTVELDEGKPITIKVKSAENSVTLTMVEEEDGETITIPVTFTFAKNYIAIKIVADGMNGSVELKYTDKEMYMQFISEEVVEKVTTYSVMEVKFNYTLTEEEFEGEKTEVATINSFGIFAEESEKAPTSIKKVKDFSKFATGEGAVAWEAPAAA